MSVKCRGLRIYKKTPSRNLCSLPVLKRRADTSNVGSRSFGFLNEWNRFIELLLSVDTKKRPLDVEHFRLARQKENFAVFLTLCVFLSDTPCWLIQSLSFFHSLDTFAGSKPLEESHRSIHWKKNKTNQPRALRSNFLTRTATLLYCCAKFASSGHALVGSSIGG